MKKGFAFAFASEATCSSASTSANVPAASASSTAPLVEPRSNTPEPLIDAHLKPDVIHKHFAENSDIDALQPSSLKHTNLHQTIRTLLTALRGWCSQELQLKLVVQEIEECFETLDRRYSNTEEGRLQLSVVAKPREGKSTLLNSIHHLLVLPTVCLLPKDKKSASVSFCAIELRYVPPPVCPVGEVILTVYWVTREEMEMRRESLQVIMHDPQARPGVQAQASANLRLLERAWLVLDNAYKQRAEQSKKDSRLFQSFRCPATKVLALVQRLIQVRDATTTGESVDMRVTVERIHLHSSEFEPWSRTIDLPGIEDIDTLRANVAREYVQQSDHIWMLLPIDSYFSTNDQFRSHVTNLASDIMRSTHSTQLRSCEVILTCADKLTPSSLNVPFKEGTRETVEELISEVVTAIDAGLTIVRGTVPLQDARFQLMDHVRPIAVSAADYIVLRSKERNQPPPIVHQAKFSTLADTNIPQLQEKLRLLVQERAPLVITVRHLLHLITQLDAVFDPVPGAITGSLEHGVNNFLSQLHSMAEKAVDAWKTFANDETQPNLDSLPNLLLPMQTYVMKRCSPDYTHWRHLDSDRSRPTWLAGHLVGMLREQSAMMALMDDLVAALSNWQEEFTKGIKQHVDMLCKQLHTSSIGRVQAPVFASIDSTLRTEIEMYAERRFKAGLWTAVTNALASSPIVIQACQTLGQASRGRGFMRNVADAFSTFSATNAAKLNHAIRTAFCIGWRNFLPTALDEVTNKTLLVANSRSQILHLPNVLRLSQEEVSLFRALLKSLRHQLLAATYVKESALPPQQQWMPASTLPAASLVSTVEQAVRMLHSHHLLNFYQRIELGFYFVAYTWRNVASSDCWPLSQVEKPCNVRLADEVILFQENDLFLAKCRDQVLDMLTKTPDARARLENIVNYVIEVFSQHGYNVADSAQTAVFEAQIMAWRLSNNCNAVPIGMFIYAGKGRCRHRALLIKYLCDLTLLPLPCNKTDRTDPMCNAVWSRVIHGVALRLVTPQTIPHLAAATNASSSSAQPLSPPQRDSFLHMWNVVTFGTQAPARLWEVESTEPDPTRRIVAVAADSRRIVGSTWQRCRGTVDETLRGVGGWTVTLCPPAYTWKDMPTFDVQSQKRVQRVMLNGKQVAVKRARDFSDVSQLALIRESNFLFALQHRNIIPLIGTVHTSETDLKAKKDLPAFVTLFIPGRTLAEVWDRQHIGWWTGLSSLARERLALQVAVAVEACHDLGILHGDISASNVRIDESGSRAYVLDFEEARYIGSEPLSADGFGRRGTDPYAPPELKMDWRKKSLWTFEAAAAVDAYALALVVAEFVTGSKIPMFSTPADCVKHLKDLREDWRSLLLPFMRVQPQEGTKSANRPRPTVTSLAQQMRALVGDEQ